MNRITATTLASLALALVIAGCNGDNTGNKADLARAPITCQDTMGYPPGPYGTDVGDTIADLTLRVQTGVNGTPAAKKLSDYRSECLAGKLKVLAMIGGAFWCPPCMQEAMALPGEWNDFKAKNAPVAFLQVVIEDSSHKPTNDMQVNEWATRFMLPFDVGSDPGGETEPYWSKATFPNQLVINLDDMTIASRMTGYVAGKLVTAINEALP